MKKEKSASTKRGRNFNILLTVVALVLIVAVGGFATYSWVEQATTLDVQMDGTIQRVPGDYENREEYHHQVTLNKGEDSAISLKDYVDKASDMMLSPVSSADGINFFMKKGTIYANSSPSDRNVSYITFDFDVTSDTKTNIYFDDGNNSQGTKDTTGNYFKPSFKFGTGDELESVRVAIQVNDNTPMIFSKSGGTNTGISDINGNTSETAPQIKKFSDYEFGKTPLFALEAQTKTKVRITIWIEGTYENLGKEYQPGKTLNMKLMLTTPWNKATTVKLVDKTANSMFKSATGTFSVYDSDNGNSKISDMTKNEIDGTWTANINGSQDNLTFKYVEGSTTYTWTASGRGDNLVYNIFDYDSTNGYGVWSPSPLQTETICIQDCIVGTSLTTGENGELDSHIKVSTDGTKYYRAAYNITESKWTVNIDEKYLEKENPKLYVQYYNDDSELTAKWNATDGRPVVDEETNERAKTYYLLDTEGGTTSDSLGSWVNEYNVYFYDGTAQQIITDMMNQAENVANGNITFKFIAYPTDTNKPTVSGDMIQDEYRFVSKQSLKYSDKINRVVFTLSRPTANGGNEKVTYTWNGDGKVNKDIYYTANSYTKN